MLHQCGHRQCSCASAAATPSFSIFLPMSGSKLSSGGADDGEVLLERSKSDNINSSSTAVTVVDCTLSLGTPSTRLDSEKKSFAASSSSFCWDVIPKKHASPAATGGGDNQLPIARRCANCNTTSTPLWRNGPRGPKVGRRRSYISFHSLMFTYFRLSKLPSHYWKFIIMIRWQFFSGYHVITRLSSHEISKNLKIIGGT